MALLAWNESLSIGIPQIDEQHKVLLAMINELSEISGNDQKRNTVPSVISRLINYTKEHFTLEESLMGAVPEQHSQMHKAEHAAFVTRVEDYTEACASGYTPYADLIEFLRDFWLATHIEKVDKELAKHLAA